MSAPARLLHWRNLDGWRGWATTWRAESATVECGADRLAARGTQLGIEPGPYRLDYELTTGADWITERLLLRVTDGGDERELDLRHDGAGRWTADGKPFAEIEAALDCDLAYSPLTNTMPVMREGLLAGGDPLDFTMAWVDVPSLTVQASRQRYEPIDARHVRYRSPHDGFSAVLELDEQGLLVRYEYLAERVAAGSLGDA